MKVDSRRSYVLVIMDSSGRRVRRLSIPRRTVTRAVSGTAAIVCCLLCLGLHGLWRHPVAREAEQIYLENLELGRTVALLERRLPAARSQALSTDLSFTQLWAKSGLGVEPRLLSMGPVESFEVDDPTAGPVTADAALLRLEPVALGLELDRLDEEAQSLQSSLGDTLEYFHDAELLLSNTPSVRPAQTPWLTSSFGKRRDPIFHNWVMHKGLDMGGHIGMEITAPADGVVVWTGRRGGYGQTVVLDHGYGLQTHFAHLSKYLVKPGDRVRRGEPIAEMGSTGKSTGPHLHYEVRRNGQPLDPRRYILDQ